MDRNTFWKIFSSILIFIKEIPEKLATLQLRDLSIQAEEIAYNELQKTFKSLIWHSKYSPIPADRKKLPPDGVVCDMWNIDSIKGNTYFEIKSSTTEFEMTINEYESMKQHRKKLHSHFS